MKLNCANFLNIFKRSKYKFPKSYQPPKLAGIKTGEYLNNLVMNEVSYKTLAKIIDEEYRKIFGEIRTKKWEFKNHHEEVSLFSRNAYEYAKECKTEVFIYILKTIQTLIYKYQNTNAAMALFNGMIAGVKVIPEDYIRHYKNLDYNLNYCREYYEHINRKTCIPYMEHHSIVNERLIN